MCNKNSERGAMKSHGEMETTVRSSLSNQIMRREVIQKAFIASAIGASCFSDGLSDEPDQIPGLDESMTPTEALEKLMEGNRRFAGGKSLAKNRDLERVREVASKQKPFAAFLGCADSRVPIEIIFDQGFGDLFVTRIAGNVAASENIGSLEFGTQILGAKVLYVLGHTKCGAVTATMQGVEVPGQISGLFQYIRPAVKVAGGDLDKAIFENVRNQAVLIAESSPVISKLIQRKELVVAGGIYDLATGLVTSVDLPV